jgi:hypothetical protein
MGPTEQSMNEANKQFHPDLTCRVCGARLYLTDHGNHQVMYHCSSLAARYWDFDRGTPEQILALDHWEKSGTAV